MIKTLVVCDVCKKDLVNVDDVKPLQIKMTVDAGEIFDLLNLKFDLCPECRESAAVIPMDLVRSKQLDKSFEMFRWQLDDLIMKKKLI